MAMATFLSVIAFIIFVSVIVTFHAQIFAVISRLKKVSERRKFSFLFLLIFIFSIVWGIYLLYLNLMGGMTFATLLLVYLLIVFILLFINDFFIFSKNQGD